MMFVYQTTKASLPQASCTVVNGRSFITNVTVHGDDRGNQGKEDKSEERVTLPRK